MTGDLPFSQAAHNNREPILDRLRDLLEGRSSVLEIGAGTGQHAVFFAQALPDVLWQATEHPQALARLQPRIAAAALSNLPDARPLDLADVPWDAGAASAIYTANTLHIVSEALVEAFFAGCSAAGDAGDRLLVYGPFNYGGRYTTESNERFDAWLRERDPRSGIRDFERVDELARAAGYILQEDCTMPANNRLLCWEKQR